MTTYQGTMLGFLDTIEIMPGGVESGCWLWPLKHPWTGYGYLNLHGKQYGAHRYSWKLFNGEFSEELDVLHSCDTPNCVNPEHLFLGSQRDNMLDMVNKGRQSKGENRPASKLTENDVLELRERFKDTSYIPLRATARAYGISHPTLKKALTGESWSHLPNALRNI